MWGLGSLVATCVVLGHSAARWRSRALVAATCLCASSVMTGYSVSLAWYRHPYDRPALDDIVHTTFPALAAWGRFGIPNAMVAAELPPALLLLLRHAHARRLLCRAVVVYSMTMAARAVLVLSTTLPDSSPLCRDPEMVGAAGRAAPPTWQELDARARRIIFTAGTTLTCGDMMFSGHTVIFVLLALVWTHYLFPGPRFRAARAGAWLWNLLGLFMIVVTRLHYTIDVLVAVYVTCSLWHQVHRCLLPRLPPWVM